MISLNIKSFYLLWCTISYVSSPQNEINVVHKLPVINNYSILLISLQVLYIKYCNIKQTYLYILNMELTLLIVYWYTSNITEQNSFRVLKSWMIRLMVFLLIVV